MAELPLNLGKVALVDEADVERVSALRWFANPRDDSTGGFYAMRQHRLPDGRLTTLYLHRFILDAPRGLFVDHINGDSLDNRRSNLRLCTPQQNSLNRKVVLSKTGYRGVSAQDRAYTAAIEFAGVRYRLGRFKDPADAARAYDRKARELHGEFASLNFPAEAA